MRGPGSIHRELEKIFCRARSRHFRQNDATVFRWRMASAVSRGGVVANDDQLGRVSRRVCRFNERIEHGRLAPNGSTGTVMSRVTTGHTLAPTLVIAEKAASMISAVSQRQSELFGAEVSTNLSETFH